MKSKMNGWEGLCPKVGNFTISQIANSQLPLGRSSFLRLFSMGLSAGVACLLPVAKTQAQTNSSNNVQVQSGAPQDLDYNAPWTTSKEKAKAKEKKVKATPQPAAPVPVAPSAVVAPDAPITPPASVSVPTVPAAPVAPVADLTPSGDPTADSIIPSAPKTRPNEVSVSGDYFLGQGKVTLPFGYALVNTFKGFGFQKQVISASRNSEYFGGTVSYSYGQAWFIDLSYANGSSSGNVAIQPTTSSINTQFSIRDEYYQAYLKYTFPALRGKAFGAYLRAGATFDQAKLTDTGIFPLIGPYSQTDNTRDILGNLGFGVNYTWRPTSDFRIILQGEGEGFYGTRHQQSDERVLGAPASTSFDNDLYGGIARGSLRLEYLIGKAGAFRVFLDGGYQGKYTEVKYSGASAPAELLYGPDVKLGARYKF